MLLNNKNKINEDGQYQDLERFRLHLLNILEKYPSNALQDKEKVVILITNDWPTVCNEMYRILIEDDNIEVDLLIRSACHNLTKVKLFYLSKCLRNLNIDAYEYGIEQDLRKRKKIIHSDKKNQISQSKKTRAQQNANGYSDENENDKNIRFINNHDYFKKMQLYYREAVNECGSIFPQNEKISLLGIIDNDYKLAETIKSKKQHDYSLENANSKYIVPSDALKNPSRYIINFSLILASKTGIPSGKLSKLKKFIIKKIIRDYGGTKIFFPLFCSYMLDNFDDHGKKLYRKQTNTNKEEQNHSHKNITVISDDMKQNKYNINISTSYNVAHSQENTQYNNSFHYDIEKYLDENCHMNKNDIKEIMSIIVNDGYLTPIVILHDILFGITDSYLANEYNTNIQKKYQILYNFTSFFIDRYDNYDFPENYFGNNTTKENIINYRKTLDKIYKIDNTHVQDGHKKMSSTKPKIETKSKKNHSHQDITEISNNIKPYKYNLKERETNNNSQIAHTHALFGDQHAAKTGQDHGLTSKSDYNSADESMSIPSNESYNDVVSEANNSLENGLSSGDYSQRKHEKTRKTYEMSANYNNIDTQFHAAYMYLNGQGVDKDEFLAREYFARAAKQGDTASQFNLAIMCSNGVGGNKNQEYATKLYEQAARKGYGRAQFNTGARYEHGIGVECNLIVALQWYTQAAQNEKLPLSTQEKVKAQNRVDKLTQQLNKKEQTTNTMLNKLVNTDNSNVNSTNNNQTLSLLTKTQISFPMTMYDQTVSQDNNTNTTLPDNQETYAHKIHNPW